MPIIKHRHKDDADDDQEVGDLCGSSNGTKAP